jgi:hypothetical protein
MVDRVESKALSFIDIKELGFVNDIITNKRVKVRNSNIKNNMM